MIRPEPLARDDTSQLHAFLVEADLTTSGLDAPGARFWVLRGERSEIVGSAGYELSSSSTEALIRSVAVASTARAAGLGTELAGFAIDAARDAGAERAWLFSRRSGPFWQKLGFEEVPTARLAAAMEGSAQVALFQETGQLGREVGWTRTLSCGHSLRQENV